MSALVAVVHLSGTGEPTLALPDIALSGYSLQNSHPPVNTYQNRQTDTPLDRQPDQIDPTKDQEPETTVLAGHIG